MVAMSRGTWVWNAEEHLWESPALYIVGLSHLIRTSNKNGLNVINIWLVLLEVKMIMWWL
jgi:hypothetical protein